MQSGPIIFLSIIIGLIVFIFLAIAIKKRRRIRALKVLANQFNFQFEAQINTPTFDRFDDLSLSNLGNHRQITSHLFGTKKGIPISIFEHQYSRSSDGGASATRHTVIAFELNDSTMTEFIITPKESINHSTSHLMQQYFSDNSNNLGFVTTTILQYPAFNEKHLLLAKDKKSINTIFSTELSDIFNHNDELSVEYQKGLFVLYFSNKLLPVDQIEDFIATGESLIRLLDLR